MNNIAHRQILALGVCEDPTQIVCVAAQSLQIGYWPQLQLLHDHLVSIAPNIEDYTFKIGIGGSGGKYFQRLQKFGCGHSLNARLDTVEQLISEIDLPLKARLIEPTILRVSPPNICGQVAFCQSPLSADILPRKRFVQNRTSFHRTLIFWRK